MLISANVFVIYEIGSRCKIQGDSISGWHCRCYVTQTDGEVTPGTPEGNSTPGFHGNVGKSNMIFNENEHPYFVFPAEDAKKIKASFETLKIAEPDYQTVFETKKAKLEVATWADPKDLESNIINAKLIVQQLDIDVKIRPHVTINKVKNPEYTIENKIADLKTPIGKGYKNILKKAAEQMCEYVVVSLELNKSGVEEARHLMRNILKQKGVHSSIKMIIIISGEQKTFSYKRTEI